jgi:hypothetical protein
MENEKKKLELQYERLEKISNEIVENEAQIKFKKDEYRRGLELYRVNSAKRVLDYLHKKTFTNSTIPTKELNTYLTHILNKLNGNIDGIELDLE